MAGLKGKVHTETAGLDRLIRIFPSLSAAVMSDIGKQGRLTLKMSLLSGQALDLKGGVDPVDKLGRRMISSMVIRKGYAVKISSYPANLFERGRRLRSGRREAGKRIITVKFKAVMAASLQGFATKSSNSILKKNMEKA